MASSPAPVTNTSTMYDTPIGVGGKINTATGQILSGPMAGQQAGTDTTTRSTPTVVTDANVRESKIPQIQQDTTKILASRYTPAPVTAPGTPGSTPGVGTPAPTGALASASLSPVVTPGAGSSTPAPSPTVATDSSPSDDPYTSFLKSLYDNNPSTPTEGAAPANDPYFSMLSQMKATSDAATQTLIGSTQAQFESRKAQLAATQAAEHAGLMQALVSNGEAKYAPLLAGSRLTADETSHILALSSIDAEESSAVAQLQKAQSDQDFQVMGKWLDHLDTLRTEKINIATKLSNDAAAATKAINDAKQHVQDQKDAALEELAKAGAPAEIIAAANAAGDIAGVITAGAGYFQDPTSTAGQYQSYLKDANAKGLTPMNAADWVLNQKTKEAYATQAAKNQSDAAFTSSDKNQQKLEQQYRAVLSKEFSSRTGALGVENAKVNQANHVNALVTQYYDPKTGDYNIPKSQYGELVLGLANLVSPSSVASDSLRSEINQATAKGDINSAIAYVTGSPQNGNTQAVIKNFIDSVDRQAETAVRNREAALQNLRDQAPTDLEQSRIEALNRSTQMVPYEGQDRISEKNINDFLTQHGNENIQTTDGEHSFYYLADQAAKIPGSTPSSFENWLRDNNYLN